MKLIRRTAIVVLALVALFFCAGAVYAYRTNYVCAPGQRMLQSDADAINVAKTLIAGSSTFASGGVQELLDAVNNRAPNCCRVDRVVNSSWIIEWNVSLSARREKKVFDLHTSLSNCGAVFRDSTFTMADTTR